MIDEVNITNKVAIGAKEFMLRNRAVDALIEIAPINCTRITLEIRSEGHCLNYYAPNQEYLNKHCVMSVHGDYIK
jgi:hypothetical protein